MRAGIVGCGVISKHYAENAAAFDAFELVACADVDPAAAARLGAEFRLTVLDGPRRSESGDAPDGAQERDDRGQVVRPHVEQRSRAVHVEDVRVRMPGCLTA